MDSGPQTLSRRYNGIVRALEVEARFLFDLWFASEISTLSDNWIMWMVLKCRFNECKQGRLQAGCTRRTVDEQAVERCLGSVPLLQVGRQLKRRGASIINPPRFQPPDSHHTASWRFIFHLSGVNKLNIDSGCACSCLRLDDYVTVVKLHFPVRESHKSSDFSYSRANRVYWQALISFSSISNETLHL